MEKKKTWLLVADSSQARIYELCKAHLFQEKNPKSLKLVGEYHHDDSRKKISELVSDKLGEFGSREYGSGNFSETTSPKVHEAEQFAIELLHHMEKGRVDKNFQDAIIIAAPAFMGLLHKHMHPTLSQLVSLELEKHYTQENERDLLEKLIAHL